MSLRTDLIPAVDAARGILDDLGLRPRTVVLRVTTWSGDAPGRGTPTHVDTAITPTPKVESAPRWKVEAPGAMEAGEITVGKISPTYSEATLRAATVWRVDGQDYRLVGLEEKNFEWRATLVRMSRGG